MNTADEAQLWGVADIIVQELGKMAEEFQSRKFIIPIDDIHYTDDMKSLISGILKRELY